MIADHIVSPVFFGTPLRLWRSVRHLWCRHANTTITAKTLAMPAHVVCEDCGWREPVRAALPQGTRTWDSSRDDARYEREKRRRLALEQQRQVVHAQSALPSAREPRGRRTSDGNIFEMKRTAAQ